MPAKEHADDVKLFFQSHPWIARSVKLPVKYTYRLIACPGLPYLNGGEKPKDKRAIRHADMNAARIERKAKQLARRKSLSNLGEVSDVDSNADSSTKGKKKRKEHPYCDQGQSPLFSRLPPEIRDLIWIQVFADSRRIDFTIPRARKLQLTALRCCQPDNDSPYHLQCHASDSGFEDVIRLLSVCRKVYNEALPRLYSESNFAFTDMTSLLIYTKVLPHAHWARIQHLTIDAATEVQDNVMQELEFRGYGRPVGDSHIVKVVQYMENLKVLNIRFALPKDDWEADGQIDHASVVVGEYFKGVREAVPRDCRVIVWVDTGAEDWRKRGWHQKLELLHANDVTWLETIEHPGPIPTFNEE